MAEGITEKQFNTEQWRPVERYEGVYEVSNLGRVRRIGKATGAITGHLLATVPIAQGYLRCHLSKNNHSKTVRLHQIVASAFLGLCPEGYEINHKDGDKTNCCRSNLEYLTHRENQAQAIIKGLYKRGMKLPQAKLTDETVREIRHLRGVVSQRQLSKRFNVSQPLIKEVQLGRIWTHIE